jgi:imidazolonepropionase-like amidohydrolase
MNGSRKGVADMLSYANTTGLIPSGLRGIWTKRASNNSKEVMEAVDKYGSTNFDTFKSLVLNLYKSNAGLIAGTDAGSMPFLVPGYSLHQELSILADLGIPVYDVLKMTTINAAMALRKESEFGTVEVGKRADLLLLHANPLSSIKNLQGRAGVMVRGIWLDETELEAITERIRLTFAN